MLNKNMDDLGKKVYNRMLEDFKNVEKSLVEKIIHNNFSIVLGEQELIEDFTDFLETKGIDIEEDINHIVMGHEINSAEPVKIIRTNRATNEIKFLDICLIKKSDQFMDIISDGLKLSNENIDEDLNKLIYIELGLNDAGKKSIYSNYLDKGKEMNEENVLNEVDKLFNIEKSIKFQVNDFVEKLEKEQENNDIMYV